ncbi:MAG: hypothetical protein IJ092_11140 [Atopobiaceae bacterium]|nr:hypothetical protein [Atopobiaceae bacterium]MBR1828610.1 hypothetical protein [Atopobiaceae bacterium]
MPRYRDQGAKRGGIGLPLVIALMVFSLLLGCAVDHFLLGGASGDLLGSLSGSGVSLSESDLDNVVATYVLDGERYELTYRDAIMENGSLDAAKKSDGSYRVPSAESVLAVARSRVITAEAERLGITVTDEDVNAYAEATFGTTDLSTIATAYGMEQDAAGVLLREAALMSALRDNALSEGAGEEPVPPAEPELGEEVTMTPEYAAYVIELAGDEWDAEAGTWASSDGPFASSLVDYEITPDGASYEAAQQAYYTAYQQHVARQADYSAQWTDYVNGLLGKASITISSLAM